MSEEGGNNGGGGGDDLSGLSGFFFYVFIVHPATAWILRPGRFERKKSIMYAIGFLDLLAAVKTGMLLLIYSFVVWVSLSLQPFLFHPSPTSYVFNNCCIFFILIHTKPQ